MSTDQHPTTIVPGVVAKDLVRDAVSAALTRLPKGSKSAVKGDDLVVAKDEGEAVAAAITEHMRAIVRENRSANMYREGKLRGVRSALIDAVPTAAAGAKRAIPAQSTSTTAAPVAPKNRAAQRVADYQAMKAAHAKAGGVDKAADGSKVGTPTQPAKVAAARASKKAPPVVVPQAS